MSLTIPGKRIRRVLMVAYVFPPAGGAGVQRVTKFVRYLPESGWDCSVLSVANPSVPVIDESLLTEIPESTVIRRARTYEPGYKFKKSVSAGDETRRLSFSPKKALKSLVRSAGNAVLHPDAQVLWYPRAVQEGKRLLQELHHDAIFVTAPPFSQFLVGSALSRWSGLPLILDYRDEWGISNRYQENRQKSWLSHVIQNRMQRRVLRQAKAVIATTKQSADALKERVHQAGSHATVSHIYNGYDKSDLASTVSHPVLPEKTPGTWRVSYVGTLWNLTDISPLVRGVQELARTSPELAGKLELVVAGRRTAEQESVLDELEKLPCRLIRKGYLSHGEAIDVMRSSDELALLLSDVPEASRVMPGKTFEYLALKRNILAIAPGGEMVDLLRSCPLAESFTPRQSSEIALHLERQILGQCELTSGLSWDASCFERRQLTQQLANVLDFAAGGSISDDLCRTSLELAGVDR